MRVYPGLAIVVIDDAHRLLGQMEMEQLQGIRSYEIGQIMCSAIPCVNIRGDGALKASFATSVFLCLCCVCLQGDAGLH